MRTPAQSQPEDASGQGSDTRLTRREVNTRIVGAAALAALAGMTGPIGAALGQPRTGGKPASTPPNSAQPSKTPPAPPTTPKDTTHFDKILRKGNSADWSLKVSIHLDSYQDFTTTTPTTGSPGAGSPGGTDLTKKIIPFDFQTAAVVFPALARTATSESSAGAAPAQIKVDGKLVTTSSTWLQDMPCGSRYGRWEMRDVKGRTIDFDFELRCKTWEVIFDDAAASKVPWPTSAKWPSDAASSLGTQMGVDPSSAAVKAALDKWSAGKPPHSLTPVQLAKFLAGRVLETIQPSGDGLMSSQTGLLQGFNLKGADATLRDARGSEHDIAALLCSIYRAAGLPARVVIGYDVTKTQSQEIGLARQAAGDLRSWVEFCIIDETSAGPTGAPKEAWIPVDVVRQRHTSSKAPPLDRPWKFFGSNDETDDVIPIAFHFHPPLDGAISHGSPCFWGWMTTPNMQIATQTVRFVAGTPSRSAPPRPGGGSGYK